MSARRFDAVLFDWCGTLVAYPSLEERLAWCIDGLGRPRDDVSVRAMASVVRTAEVDPSLAELVARCDLSADAHDDAKLAVAARAGLDDALATALAQSYADWATYRTHPEAVDVVRTLHGAGVRMAVVSDFHVDLRPWFARHALLDCIAGFALSCELGATKPDRRMFEHAVTVLGARPDRCLMVGDNPYPDTGAAALGIPTLLLPVVHDRRPRLLDLVVSLVLDDA